MKTTNYFILSLCFLFTTSLFFVTSCETNNSSTSSGDCSSQKDSLKIVMNIPIKIKPEYVNAYKIAFEKCREETLKEETCEAYELFQSYKDSTEFHLFEMWTNKPGHQQHMKTEHIKRYFNEIEGMNDKPNSETVVVTVCPKINQ